jgi:Bacterial Ig-like domain (group 2)
MTRRVLIVSVIPLALLAGVVAWQPTGGTIAVTCATYTLAVSETTPCTASLSGVRWTSSNTVVATVSASGVVTGLVSGTTTIQARLKNQRGTATVTVTGSPAPQEVCGNGIDDDGDGLVDEDPPCTPTSTITMGETAILVTGDGNNANLLIAQQATLGQTATLQSLSFYVTAVAGALRLGVYDATGPNGQPGIKLAETASFPAVAGWNTQPVASVTLGAGPYYLAYLPSDNGLGFVKASGAASYFFSYAYGAMPATFSTVVSTTTSHWSFYGTLTPVTTTVPVPTNLAPNGTTFPTGTAAVGLSWTGVPNAEKYFVRVQDLTDPNTPRDPRNTCPDLQVCAETTETSFPDVVVVSAHNYRWWVHSVVGGVASDPAFANFTVAAPIGTGACDGSNETLIVGSRVATAIEFCHDLKDGTGALATPTECVVTVDGQEVYRGTATTLEGPNAAGKYRLSVPGPFTVSVGDHPLRIYLHFVRTVNGAPWHEWGDTGPLTWRATDP